MTVLGSPLRPVLRSPLYSPLVGKWGGAFSPSALFQTGDILLWYDPSDLSTMFKNTAGTQPVTADGDSVALMLDKGQWGGKTLEQVLAAQVPVLNDDFSSYADTAALMAAGWTQGANTTLTLETGTKIRVANVGTVNGLATKAITGLIVGRRYRIEATVLAISAGFARMGAWTTPAIQQLAERSTPGQMVASFVATATTMYIPLWNRNDTNAYSEWGDVSVKEIPGYHRTQATGTSMPKYKTDGTLHWLLYDGSDDGNVTPSINWGTDEVAICAGVTKSSDAAAGAFAEFSASSSSNNGSFALLAPSAAADNLFWRSKGTGAADNTPTGFVAPFTGVLTGTGKIASDTSTLRANGAVSATSATDQGTGNFGSYPLYFGRRGGTTLPFNGREYQTVIRSRLLSAAELASLETFVAEKTGVIL